MESKIQRKTIKSICLESKIITKFTIPFILIEIKTIFLYRHPTHGVCCIKLLNRQPVYLNKKSKKKSIDGKKSLSILIF